MRYEKKVSSGGNAGSEAGDKSGPRCQIRMRVNEAISTPKLRYKMEN